ncbi:hypothetical protein BZA05DRAFT_333598 [Tricharina praecox]|uniref:uncharacterized protein n=1 Tax=Tricharina praecox TaxID=43433 RepID=UPI002220AADD|nr:uncharacterized protein BZA05DRAFT_345062 [Tricharina praecox]XP_051342319.1 uncharacterized protein BZA05DRAFT_333598 [Tricharina praecox]KAI5841210.1 hypothetical protein BZA05DRAFT_345062 [Tricharina praecox]KAI5856101.1 hypothetical protein BZA05DRAFT_333598 [Tricharina praecox]
MDTSTPHKRSASPESYDATTLATLWAFTFVALLVIATRLSWRYRRNEPFFTEDLWMAFAMVPLLTRLACTHSTLVNFTVHFDRELHPLDRMAPDEIERRRFGSRMILPGRICYAGFLWCMKVCILIWLEKVTGKTHPYGRAIKAWPDPGSCVKAQAQLMTMGALNITTDICLMVIPLPLIFRVRLPVFRKVQLALLFCVSFFVISITVIRMPIIVGNGVAQKSRTLWASIEVMTACFVANAPVFNSFMHTVRNRRRSYIDHQQVPHPSEAGRRIRMPVTGQDSFGSLTRNERLESQVAPPHPPSPLPPPLPPPTPAGCTSD